MSEYSIGIDLGGTKILTAIVDVTTGSVICSVKKKTKSEKGPDKIIKKIIKSVHQVINDVSIDTSLKITDGELSYGLFSSVNLVCIHDTGNASSSSTAYANSNYMLSQDSASWHYTVGEDVIYQNMSESYTAWHAGSGARVFSLEDTLINASKYGNSIPIITINASGYYCINGEATTLRPYSDLAGTVKDSTVYLTSQITSSGIYYTIGANGNYYLNKTYYNDTFGYICNFGGNKNAIGIETTVNDGSDIFATFHNCAKLVSDILVRKSLTPHEVLLHNSFSGKDCPHAMINGDLVDEFMNMVEIEYMIRKYYSDYTITFESLSPDIINNNGYIIGSVDSDTTVYYKVTITKDDVSNYIILSSTVLS